MPNNLSASAILDAQAKINAMYGGDTPTKYQYFEPALSVKALFENNDASIQLIREGNKYIKQRIYHLQRGSTTLDYDGDGTGGSFDCSLSAGTGPTSGATTYDNNILKTKIVEFETDLQENLYSNTDLLAERLAAAMYALRANLDAEAVTFLNSSKTPVNSDGSLPDGISFNATSDVYEVDPTKIDLTSPDGLNEFDFVVLNNNIQPGYWMLTGRYNFASAMKNADFRRLNDNERYLIGFDNFNMYVDPRRLDSQLSSKTTFAVGRGTYAAWNVVDPELSMEPREVPGTAEFSTEYYIEDPILRIWDNGQLRPVRYNVFEQFTCNAVNTNTMRRRGVHRFEVSFNGGLAVAPPSPDTHTGVLRFDAIDAV